MLFVGTSFSVGVTDQILSSALGRKRPVYSIDPASSDIDGVVDIRETAESSLPELLTLLP